MLSGPRPSQMDLPEGPPPLIDFTRFGRVVAGVAGVIGAYAVGSVFYKYVFAPRTESKTITPALLVKILTEIVKAWQESLAEAEQQRKSVLESLKPEEREMWPYIKSQITAALAAKLVKLEAQICLRAGISKPELRAACKRFESDPRVSFLLKMLASHQVTRPDVGGPGAVALTLEQTLAIMSNVLELSITVMENTYKELIAEAFPDSVDSDKRPELTQELVNKLNTQYQQRFAALRKGYYDELGVHDMLVSRATMAYQQDQEFKKMLAAHSKAKQRRFAAMGLSG
jgi:hypothetical protein